MLAVFTVPEDVARNKYCSKFTVKGRGRSSRLKNLSFEGCEKPLCNFIRSRWVNNKTFFFGHSRLVCPFFLDTRISMLQSGRHSFLCVAFTDIRYNVNMLRPLKSGLLKSTISTRWIIIFSFRIQILVGMDPTDVCLFKPDWKRQLLSSGLNSILLNYQYAFAWCKPITVFPALVILYALCYLIIERSFSLGWKTTLKKRFYWKYRHPN